MGSWWDTTKKNQDVLVPHLKDIINKVLEIGQVPETWKEAYITLIPKQHKDMRNPKNFHPISLLNCDYTLFAAILANGLKKIMSNLIHKQAFCQQTVKRQCQKYNQRNRILRSA